MNKNKKRSMGAVIVLAMLMFVMVGSTFANPSYINGLLFIDSNQNGVWDVGEEGYKGVYGSYEKNGAWEWGYQGTQVLFKGVGAGPEEAIVVETAGYQETEAGEAACTQQGSGRPCAGTFGFISFVDGITWQAAVAVPDGYRLTTAGMQTVVSGADNGTVDFGIVPAVIPPIDDTQPAFYIIGPGVNGDPVAGGSAHLLRDAGGFSIDFMTTDLPVGHVVTLWAHIFNNPIACEGGCGFDDIFDGAPGVQYVNPDGTAGRPGTDHSLNGLGGFVVTNESATFSGQMDINTSPNVVFGNGLHNPLGAEIHFLLRDHGPASDDPAVLQEQLTMGAGGCTNFGGTGDYLCTDFQVAMLGQ